MQTQKAIEQLGYSAREAKVYLAALRLGDAHITRLAIAVGLPRTSVQALAERLRVAGLMDFYVMRRYAYWVARDPERLGEDLARRAAVLRETLPALITIREAARTKASRFNDAAIGFIRMIADASPQPVLIADSDASIIYVNDPWQQQFGYVLADVRGKNPKILQSGSTPREVFTRMWQTLKAGKLFQSNEIIDKRKDGTTFAMMTTIFPLMQRGRKYYIQILDDVSEGKRVEALHQEFSRPLK